MSADRVFKVSKAAVKRVLNPLPVPTKCPHCESTVTLVNNKVIYRRQYGEWPFAYLCSNAECDSYVGLHPRTDIPKGTLANKATRAARKAAHQAFDPLLESSGAPTMDRTQAYAWLAAQMGIATANAHVAWFDIDQCNQVVQICNTHMKGITK